MFETEKEVLEWYESQPRAVSAQLLEELPWNEIKKHPLDPAFIPVIVYMRDVESFTEIYYDEMRLTPTGRDPIIRRFMDRWREEEDRHAKSLNRFLSEAGFENDAEWEKHVRKRIPAQYMIGARVASFLANCFGRHFSGVHMVWGAINEMTTLQGYRRLWTVAGHPILETLLRAIAQEESIHTRFYWNIARLKLERSGFTQKFSRYMVEKFWSPVGEGTKPRKETDYLILKLFNGDSGIEFFDRNVSKKLEQLPGFNGLKRITERIAEASASLQPQQPIGC
ncbi:MAG: acyl-ACP desaturase [Pyrinomonadaceae bacterium]